MVRFNFCFDVRLNVLFDVRFNFWFDVRFNFWFDVRYNFGLMCDLMFVFDVHRNKIKKNIKSSTAAQSKKARGGKARPC